MPSHIDELKVLQIINQTLQEINDGISSPIKIPVRFTTTANITLSGLGLQAGGDWAAPLTDNDRILVKNQTDPATNGLYNARSGTWTRTTDADGNSEVIAGMIVVTTEGATLADSLWELSTNNPIVVGTTPLAFTFFGGAGMIGGGGIAGRGTYWLNPTTLSSLAATNTELDFVDGVTSSIQTQLDTKFQQGGNPFGATAILGTNDANALAFETNNIERARFLSTGEFGINISPSFLFHLKATALNTTVFAIRNPAGTADRLLMSLDGSENVVYDTGNVAHIFRISGTEKMRITNNPSNNIGINQSSPTANLHIVGTVASDPLFVETNSGTDAFIVKDSGNVGVGIFAPLADLHISKSGIRTLFRIDSDTQIEILRAIQDLPGRNYVTTNMLGVGGGISGLGDALTVTGSTNLQGGLLVNIGGANKLGVHGTGGEIFINSNNRFGIGEVLGINGMTVIRGLGTTSVTYGLKVHDSTGINNALIVRDDGLVGIGGNLGIGTSVSPASMVGGVMIKNGTAPTANAADQFSFYSADQVAGNAAPHFKTENGDVVKLFSDAGWTAITGVASKAGYATSTATLQQVAESLKAIQDHLFGGMGLLKA